MNLVKLSPASHRHWGNFPDSRASSPNLLLPGKGWDILEWRKSHQSPQCEGSQCEGSPSPSRDSQPSIPKEKQEKNKVKVAPAAGKGNISIFYKSFPQSITLADEMTFIVPL